MKKFLAVIILIMVATSAYALTEEEYSEFMKDESFAAADSEMTRVLVGAKRILPKEAYDLIRKSQREWIQTVRDEEAEDLIDMNGFSRVRAYTAVTKNRVGELQSIVNTMSRKIPEPGVVKADKDYVTVIAKGEGSNRTEALESSWTEAVRIAVGMIISSKTELNNEELNENIIAHSRGAIEDFDILDEQTTTTGTQVIIQAKVHREVLEDVSKTYTEAQTVEADTGAVAEVIKGQENDKAKATTIQAKQKSGAELLKELLDSYGPENFFSATLDPKIKFAMNKEVPLVLLAASRRNGAASSANIAALRKPYIQVNEKFNQDVFWKEFIPKLHKALEGVATSKAKYFYDDNVRKANQSLSKEGFLLNGGIVTRPQTNRGIVTGHKISVSYRDRKTNKKVDWYLPYSVKIQKDDNVYQVVVPNDNASFTVYAMPFKKVSFRGSNLSSFYADNFRIKPDESINEEGAAMLLSFIQFKQKMCRPVTYAISYLDKSEEVITNQIIRTGPRAFGVYRSLTLNSISRSLYWSEDVLILAPGFVNGDDKNPVYGINPEYKYNLFLGTGNYNKTHPEEGYEVELDTEELKRLNSMKFEVIYENQ